MKHTPGPWHATIEDLDRPEPQDARIWTVGPHKDKLNWENDSNQEGYGMLMADAILASAAPQLLEALKEIIDLQMEQAKPYFIKANAAIAKAEGRSE